MKMNKIITSLSFVALLGFTACYDADDTIVDPNKQVVVPIEQIYKNGVVLSGESGATLIADLQKYFADSDNITYSSATNIMYTQVDRTAAGKLECVYSGYTIDISATESNSTINGKEFNCEHTVPQSLFNEQEPMKSDMHHLFPSRDGINTDRSNYPFADVPDANGKYWYTNTTTERSAIIDPDGTSGESPEYSKLSKSNTFEPRDARKGDIARAGMYFYVIYGKNTNATKAIAFIEKMLPLFKQWDKQDPVDTMEKERNEKIYQKQGNYNPFVLDATLADRVFN